MKTEPALALCCGAVTKPEAVRVIIKDAPPEYEAVTVCPKGHVTRHYAGIENGCKFRGSVPLK